MLFFFLRHFSFLISKFLLDLKSCKKFSICVVGEITDKQQSAVLVLPFLLLGTLELLFLLAVLVKSWLVAELLNVECWLVAHIPCVNLYLFKVWARPGGECLRYQQRQANLFKFEVSLVYGARLIRTAMATKRKPVNKKTKQNKQVAGGRGRHISVSSRTVKATEKTLSWKNKQKGHLSYSPGEP